MRKVIQAILNAPISPSAKEEAAILAEAWIEQFAEFDRPFKTLAVEVPFFLWLDGNTLLVGVMDRLARDKLGIIGSEWKTCKAPTRNKDGEDSAWWNEEKWLEQIMNTPQLSIYGLAMLRGSFVIDPSPRKPKIEIFGVHNPRILTRAAVKDSPPRFWPTDPADGIFEFPDSYLEKIVAPSILARAAGIRAMRATGSVPWALPGFQCENKFHKMCPYHEEFCLPHKHPKSGRMVFDSNDPGYVAISFSGVKLDNPDPDLVIFSASSYQTALQCDEKYRILTTIGGGEETAELEIGTGLHSGVAAFYKGQMG
jgi:PD-(D/E)XK nuclease superfamily